MGRSGILIFRFLRGWRSCPERRNDAGCGISGGVLQFWSLRYPIIYMFLRGVVY
jgi:hypothetical protein